MRTGRFVSLCAVLTLAAVTARAEDSLWSHDFEEAKAAAAKDKKDLLMEFTGSDWCPPCIALNEKVLSQEAFQSEAPKHFVLLKLDSPRDKSKQTEKEIEQYKTLSKQYGVSGVPTMILADENGKPYAKIVGYGGTAATEYTRMLTEKTALRKERDDYLAKAASAQGVAKARLLDKAISGIDSELALGTYRETIDEIIALDEKDEAKLKSKYEGLVKAIDFKRQLQEIQQAAGKDPAAGVAKIDALIEESKVTGESLQEALFAKGAILFRSDKAASRKALEEAAAAAPDSDLGKRIDGIIKANFKDEEEKPKEEKKDEAKKPAKSDDK